MLRTSIVTRSFEMHGLRVIGAGNNEFGGSGGGGLNPGSQDIRQIN